MSGGISATTVLLLATAAVGTYTALEQGKQQKAQFDYQADQAQADADAVAAQSQVEAGKIRESVQKQRASARAALSGAGVNVDTGTAELIQSDIEQQGEEDALTTIFNGGNNRSRIKAQAEGFTIAGKNAQQAGYMNAANSALSGGAKAYGSWKGKAA